MQKKRKTDDEDEKEGENEANIKISIPKWIKKDRRMESFLYSHFYSSSSSSSSSSLFLLKQLYILLEGKGKKIFSFFKNKQINLKIMHDESTVIYGGCGNEIKEVNDPKKNKGWAYKFIKIFVTFCYIL